MLKSEQVENAKPRERDYKLADGGGLYLYVTKKGFRSWRFKYRFGDREKRLIFGSFPDLSLKQARAKRDDARLDLREGRDPGLEQKRLKLVRSAPSERNFETFARAWHGHEKARWRPVHADDVITSLERDVFPDLGRFDLSDIDEVMVIATLQKVERRGAIETAHTGARRRRRARRRSARGRIGQDRAASRQGRPLEIERPPPRRARGSRSG